MLESIKHRSFIGIISRFYAVEQSEYTSIECNAFPPFFYILHVSKLIQNITL